MAEEEVEEAEEVGGRAEGGVDAAEGATGRGGTTLDCTFVKKAGTGLTFVGTPRSAIEIFSRVPPPLSSDGKKPPPCPASPLGNEGRAGTGPTPARFGGAAVAKVGVCAGVGGTATLVGAVVVAMGTGGRTVVFCALGKDATSIGVAVGAVGAVVVAGAAGRGGGAAVAAATPTRGGGKPPADPRGGGKPPDDLRHDIL